MGVKGGHARQRQRHGFKGDDVVPFLCAQQIISAVVNMEMHFWVVQHAEVVLFKKGRGFEHFRDNLHSVNGIEIIERQGAAGDAGTETHEQHVGIIALEQEWQYTLQPVHFHAPFNGGGRLYAVNP